MSKKRRTRQQKIQAKHRFGSKSTKLVLEHTARVQPVRSVKSGIEEWHLFRYDKKLIYKDLLKSLLFTVFILGVLFVIYFWLK